MLHRWTFWLVILLGFGVLTLVVWLGMALPASSPTTNDDTVDNETVSTANDEDAPAEPIIYVTIVSHNEDTRSPAYPDYSLDQAALDTQRDDVAQFAATVTAHGAAYDFQTDWNFLLGLQTFDDASDSTDGKNLLAYLHDLGVSIDPHSHEGLSYNYADVAYLISTFGVEPSGIVGGFLASPVSSSKLEYLWEPIVGSTYPSYTWTPTAAWGGGTANHQDEMLLWTSGIWRPQDEAHIDVHDPDAPLPVIGHYNSDWTGLDRLLELQAAGELEAGKMYTVTIMTNQYQYTDDYVEAFAEKIDAYTDDVDAGRMTWMTLPNILTTWQTQYNESPSHLVWDGDDTKSELSPGSDSGTSSDTPRTGGCGDGVCALFERTRGTCTEDCGS